jgi:hypothetical protein
MIYLLPEKRGKMFWQKNFEVVNPRLYALTDVPHDCPGEANVCG